MQHILVSNYIFLHYTQKNMFSLKSSIFNWPPKEDADVLMSTGPLGRGVRPGAVINSSVWYDAQGRMLTLTISEPGANANK